MYFWYILVVWRDDDNALNGEANVTKVTTIIVGEGEMGSIKFWRNCPIMSTSHVKLRNL